MQVSPGCAAKQQAITGFGFGKKGKYAVLCVGLNKAFLSLKKYKAEFAKFALAIFRRILRAAPGHLLV